jgi:hypothetical protein
VPVALPDVPVALLDVVPAVLVEDDDGDASVFFAFVSMNAPEGVADGVLLAAEPAAAEPSCRHPVAVIVSDRCCEVLVLVVGSCAPAAIAPAKMTVATPLSHILFCIVSSDAAVCKRCSVGNLWPWR